MMTCAEIQKWLSDTSDDSVHATVLRERNANSLMQHVFEEKREIGRGWEIPSLPGYGSVRSYILPSAFSLNGFVKIDKQEIDKLDKEMCDSRTYVNYIARKVGLSMAQKEDTQFDKFLKHITCTVEDVTTPSTLGSRAKLADGVGRAAAYMILSNAIVDTLNLCPGEESLVAAMQLSEVVTRENFKPANDSRSKCLLGSIPNPHALQSSVHVLHQCSTRHSNGSEMILKPNQKLVLDKGAGMIYTGAYEFAVTKVWDDLYVHYRYECAHACTTDKFRMIVNN